MDVERTMQFMLEEGARIDARLAAMADRQGEAEERQAKAEERQAKAEERQAKAEEQMAAIRQILSETAMVQREQGRMLMQLEAAQLVTEEKLQGLIDALRRGTNGHQ